MENEIQRRQINVFNKLEKKMVCVKDTNVYKLYLNERKIHINKTNYNAKR